MASAPGFGSRVIPTCVGKFGFDGSTGLAGCEFWGP